MQTEIEPTRARTPVVRKAFAGIVLVAAAALLLKIVIGFVVAIFWTVIVVAAVLAVLWAVKTLVW
jgi:hypothetical protein